MMRQNNKIKPALLVIDIQNTYLKHIPDKDKEAALTRINMYIDMFLNHDYKAFLVKDAIMSHNKDYTKNIEIMFDAVGYDVIQLILKNADQKE